LNDSIAIKNTMIRINEAIKASTRLEAFTFFIKTPMLLRYNWTP